MNSPRPLSPAMANFLNTALQHQRSGQFAQAEALYQLVLQALPKHGETLRLYGALLLEKGQPAKAMAMLEHAYSADRGNVATLMGLSQAAAQMNNLEQAAALIEEALRLSPTDKSVLLQSARFALNHGDSAVAIAKYQYAIDRLPEHLEIWKELGEAQYRIGDFGGAIASLECWLAHDPRDVGGRVLLGAAYSNLDKRDHAIAQYEEALQLDAKCIDAWLNLGSTLMADSTRLDKAQAALEAALKLSPHDAHIYSNLGIVFTLRAEPQRALANFRRAIELSPNASVAWSNLLFLIQHMPEFTAAEIYAEHQRFGEYFESRIKRVALPCKPTREANRRLRIGYLSGDFRDHAVYHFIAPILACHNTELFDIYCYYNHPAKDQFTENLQKVATHWLDCFNMSDDQLAARILEDKVDILVDLSGHTSGNRLLVLARKPAPIQATWIGYPGTTGLSAVDYRITDEFLDPIGQTEALHSEKLVRLQGGNFHYTAPANSPPVNDLPSLSAEVFTFACLNSPKKITDEVVSIWASILRDAPHSRLLLSADDESIKHRLQSLFSSAGVHSERIEFLPWLPVGEFLRAHHAIDVALDPFPYNGGTTTLHAAWMGVPTVTLAGASAVSRSGVSIGHFVGLPQLVAETTDAYKELALSLYRDRANCALIRAALRPRLEGVDTNAQVLAKKIETLYQSLWQTHLTSKSTETET
jgi:protein O-GlcNAc transferase